MDRAWTAGLVASTLLLSAPWLAAAATPSPWLVGDMQSAGRHPRTVLLPDERPAIAERLLGNLGPHPAWRDDLKSRIAAQAARVSDPFDQSSGATQLRANTARAAAFLFYLDADPQEWFADAAERRTMGEKAALYLRHMKTERSESFPMIETRTFQEVHLWSETLDLLLGADVDVLGPDRPLVIQNVADLTADLYAAYAIDGWMFERTSGNNHLSKAAAAIGLAAIVLNGEHYDVPLDDGRYDIRAWVDFALRNVDVALRDFLTDADGGYAEGGSYFVYSAIDHVPFAWAWHRYTGGAGYPVDPQVPVPPFFSFDVSAPYTVPSLLGSGVLAAHALWAVRIMLPDGTLPPFDDATPGSRYFYGVHCRADVPQAGLLRWAWERTGWYTGGSVDATLLAAVAADGTIASVDPWAAGIGRTQVMPFAGQAVFRSGWDAGAVYALMTAEHGRARGWAQSRWGDRIDGVGSHEHADPGGVMLYAYGAPLLIDGGYLGFEHHSKVNKPANHSILLVDNRGPQLGQQLLPELAVDDDGHIVPADPHDEGGWVPGADGDAYIVSTDDFDDGAPYAEMVTRYDVMVRPTAIRRGIVFLADRFVVLRDRATTEAPTGEHTYTVQLHGNGGGTSGGTFAASADGAIWSRSSAQLRAVVTATAPLVFTTRPATHDAGGWGERTHDVLDATASVAGGAPIEFLTLLAPEASAVGGYDEVAVQVDGCGGPCIEWATSTMTCATWSGFARTVSAPDGRPLLVANGGAYCDGPDQVAGLFWGVGDAPTSVVSARFAHDSGGSVSAWRVKVHAGAPVVQLDLPAVPGQVPSGACRFAQSGGRWRVDALPVAVVATETPANAATVIAHLRIVGIPAGEAHRIDLGQDVVLSADRSCAAGNAPALMYRFSLIDQPAESALEVIPRQDYVPAIRMTPDLPGVYRVEVTVLAPLGAARAEIAFEVEGEGRYEPPALAAPSLIVAGGGCGGCGSGSAVPWVVLVGLLWRSCPRRRVG